MSLVNTYVQASDLKQHISQSFDSSEYKGEELGSTREGTRFESHMEQVRFCREYKLPK